MAGHKITGAGNLGTYRLGASVRCPWSSADALGAGATAQVGALLLLDLDDEDALSAVSAITLTPLQPVLVRTAAAHGYATGDQVFFAGVVGTTELNGNSFTITVVDADEFTLDGTDGNDFSAYVSGGTITRHLDVTLTSLLDLHGVAGDNLIELELPAEVGDFQLGGHYAVWGYGLSADGGVTLASLVLGTFIVVAAGQQVTPAGYLGNFDFGSLVPCPWATTDLLGGGATPQTTALVLDIVDALANATIVNAIKLAQQPVAITTNGAHNFATGDKLFILDVLGMVEINEQVFTITKTGADAFTLDGTEQLECSAYISGGLAARCSDAAAPVVWHGLAGDNLHLLQLPPAQDSFFKAGHLYAIWAYQLSADGGQTKSSRALGHFGINAASANIPAGGIAAATLAAEALTAEKIADGALTAAKLAADAITAEKFAAAAIAKATLDADLDTHFAQIAARRTTAADAYLVMFRKNGQLLAAGVVSPTLTVMTAGGATLFADAALTNLGDGVWSLAVGGTGADRIPAATLLACLWAATIEDVEVSDGLVVAPVG